MRKKSISKTQNSLEVSYTYASTIAKAYLSPPTKKKKIHKNDQCMVSMQERATF